MYNYYVEKKKQEKKAISQDKEKKENKIRQKRKKWTSRIPEMKSAIWLANCVLEHAGVLQQGLGNEARVVDDREDDEEVDKPSQVRLLI